VAERRKGPVPGRYPISAGEAELLGDADRPGGWLLVVDEVPQSYVDLDDPTYLDFEYVRLMADLIDCLPDGPLDAAHVGGAGCTLPRYVAATRPGSRQVVFEPDAGLVQLVREQLALKAVHRLKVRITDGRSGVAALPDRSDDLVLLDAFSGASMAGDLATAEFAWQVARVLRPTGIFLLNVADGPGLAFARRVVATVGSVFAHVLLLGEPGVLRGRRFGNLVIAASPVPLPVAALTRRVAGGAVPARCVEGLDLNRFQAGALPLRDGTEVIVPTPPGRIFG
jgi:hypothetical protein